MSGAGLVMREWEVGLNASFTACGRTVWVRLLPMRDADAAPRFETLWLPSMPAGFGPGELAHFDAELGKAKGKILAHFESLGSR